MHAPRFRLSATKSTGLSLALALCLALSACAVGPDYVVPAQDVGAGYKEAPAAGKGWMPANPSDGVARAEWWTVFGDADLDRLMGQVEGANQTIAQAEANYRQALALVRSAGSDLFPQLGASTGATRSGSNSSQGVGGAGSRNQYSLSGTVSWEIDLWGRIRRGVQASEAGAQASGLDLANTRLSVQSALAQNYFQLRILDQQQGLLAATIKAYERSLQTTNNRYDVGVAGLADVSVARTQLENTRAQAVDLEWQRAQFEHAIAVLVGIPPSRFTLPPIAFHARLPTVPAGLPSQLLERRPDVAAAERRVAQANAEIGVAQAAWFPDLVLSANGGFSSGRFADLLAAPAHFWSLGPSLALKLFDGGKRQSAVDQAQAAYDGQAAAYRQAVLTALREVENYLAQVQVLAREQAIQSNALAFARESLRLTLNQYQQGLIDYISVATVQATTLNIERNAIALAGKRLIASVQLITALGGGWHVPASN